MSGNPPCSTVSVGDKIAIVYQETSDDAQPDSRHQETLENAQLVFLDTRDCTKGRSTLNRRDGRNGPEFGAGC